MFDPANATPSSASATKDIALLNRWWVQVSSLLFLYPVGLVLMLCTPAYRNRNGQKIKVGKVSKTLLIVLWLPVWLVALLIILASMIGGERLAAALGAAAGDTVRTLREILE